jgi:hypothetical protein
MESAAVPRLEQAGAVPATGPVILSSTPSEPLYLSEHPVLVVPADKA